ncbi:MAG: ribbon-helix-helix domain-containing protein [Candidatus Helarchaeota archaeon]
MTSTSIPIKLKKEIIEKIDYLVKIGRYPNRNAAIREIVEEKLSKENYIIEDFSRIEEKVEPILRKLLKVKNLKVNLKSKESATEMVSEGRGR